MIMTPTSGKGDSNSPGVAALLYYDKDKDLKKNLRFPNQK